MSAHKNVYLDIDVRGTSGEWLRSWMEAHGDSVIQYHTLSARRWRGIQNRCKPGGLVQRKRPTYIGCINGFIDFQDFAEWCQVEPGHFDVEVDGKHLHLDKDLIEPGNKVYSRDTCCFVPSRINQLMVFPKSRSQEGFPIGCSFHKRVKQYTSYLSGPDSKTIYLGYYRDPMQAHRAWQSAKAASIREAAETMPSHLVKGALAITRIAERLEFDLNAMKESKF